MVTYKDAVWQLALSKAHSYYGGDMMPQTEGAHTVAWIFEVTESQVFQDINKVYAAACHKALHG
jgi:hypothetical protein